MELVIDVFCAVAPYHEYFLIRSPSLTPPLLCQHSYDQHTASRDFPGNPLLRHKELGHNAALCCSAWLHDGYFLCYLDLSFLIRLFNFPLSSYPKWAIPGRNQTLALDHISGDMCEVFFPVQIWILINCKATCVTHYLYFSFLEIYYVLLVMYYDFTLLNCLFLLLLLTNSWVNDAKFHKDYEYFFSLL